MAEYIEREKVLELIGSFKRNDVTKHCVDYAAGWNEALEQIESSVAEDIPAADVRPERHGHWIYQEPDDEFSWKPYLCSACGEKGGKNYTEFCSHCGAKMDGKDGE